MFDINYTKKVFVKMFMGKKMVDIREVYDKNGKMGFSAKGIALTMEAWTTFKGIIPSIERELSRLK